MAIIDDREQKGTQIELLDSGTFFLVKNALFLKASEKLVVDLQSGISVPFNERCLVQPVSVDIFIRSNKG